MLFTKLTRQTLISISTPILISIGCGVQTDPRAAQTVSSIATTDINPQEVTKLAITTG